jgi:hypothetical protein
VVSALGMPNSIQLARLYNLSYQITYRMFQPIHMVCVDQRTRNLCILAGHDDDLEFEIALDGEVS